MPEVSREVAIDSDTSSLITMPQHLPTNREEGQKGDVQEVTVLGREQ